MSKIVNAVTRPVKKGPLARPGRHAKRSKKAQRKQTFFTGGPCRR